jgi:TetR/AcrR family transcriptional regulator
MGIAERREREREQRRLDIISAAEKVFFSRGYSAATMDEIAQEAELSRGTLYLYFKGKDEVHREIVANGMNMLFDLIKAGIDEGSTGMAKLGVIWDSCIKFSKEYADYCDAYIHYEAKEVHFSSEEELEQWLNRYKVIGLTIRTIEEGMTDGSVRQDMTPSTLTLLFWTQITGAIQYVRFKKALIRNLLKIPPDEFLKYCRRLVFEQLGPK